MSDFVPRSVNDINSEYIQKAREQRVMQQVLQQQMQLPFGAAQPPLSHPQMVSPQPGVMPRPLSQPPNPQAGQPLRMGGVPLPGGVMPSNSSLPTAGEVIFDSTAAQPSVGGAGTFAPVPSPVLPGGAGAPPYGSVPSQTGGTPLSAPVAPSAPFAPVVVQQPVAPPMPVQPVMPSAPPVAPLDSFSPPPQPAPSFESALSPQMAPFADLDDKPAKPKRNHPVLRSFFILLWAVTVVLLALAAFGFATRSKPITTIGKYGLYYQNSDNMAPDIPYGCLVLGVPVSADGAEIGDNVVFVYTDDAGGGETTALRRVVNVLSADNQTTYDTISLIDNGSFHQQFSTDDARMRLTAYVPMLGTFIDWLIALVWFIVGAFVMSLAVITVTRQKKQPATGQGQVPR